MYKGFFCFKVLKIKVGDIIKILALIFILLGLIILLKYLFKKKSTVNESTIINVDYSTLEDKKENDKDIEDTQNEKDEFLSEMFSDKRSIFLMICLFLFFIAIIIYIALGGFF